MTVSVPAQPSRVLAKLRPVFKVGGPVTAGNSSQMTDGAAVALVVSEDYLETNRQETRSPAFSPSRSTAAPRRSWASVRLSPFLLALKLAGLKQKDIEPDRAERGLCRPGPGRHQDPGAESGYHQCQRRRHCPRSSAGLHRGQADHDPAA